MRAGRAGAIVVAVAAGVWLIAVGRVLHTNFSVPSPARFTEYFTATGRLEPPSWPHCQRQHVIVGSQVWAYCPPGSAAPGDYDGFIRHDLATARADLLWPVTANEWWQLTAAAPAPDGGLFIATWRMADSPEATAALLGLLADREPPPGFRFSGTSPVLHLRGEGGSGDVEILPGRVIAMRPVGEALEAISVVGDGATLLHRRPLSGGGWASVEVRLDAPERGELGGEAGNLAGAAEVPQVASPVNVRAAERGEGGWTLWGVSDDGGPPGVTLWRAELDAGGASRGRWVAARRVEGVTTRGRGRDLPEILLDGGSGGAWAARDRRPEASVVLVRAGDTWARQGPPVEVGSEGYASVQPGDLHFSGGEARHRARWEINGVTFTEDRGRWLCVRERGGAVVAGHCGAAASALDPRKDGGVPDDPKFAHPELGPPIATDFWLTSRPRFIPAPQGGHWILGAFGSHVHVDEDLRRTDAFGLFGRIALHFRHYRRYAWYNDRWLTLPALKMVTLPVVLLGLPLGLLAAVRRRRWWPRVAVAWLVLAAGFGYWFWIFTSARWF